MTEPSIPTPPEEQIKKLLDSGIVSACKKWPALEPWVKLWRENVGMRKTLAILAGVVVCFLACLGGAYFYGKSVVEPKASDANVTIGKHADVHATQVTQASNVAISSQSGNSSFKNNGAAVNQIGTNNANLTQIFSGSLPSQINLPANSGSLTVNYNQIFGSPQDTELKEFITNIDNKVGNATNELQLTKNDVKMLTDLLTKLDERTEDIHKLPDGRTQFGYVLAGNAPIFVKYFESAERHFVGHDFKSALDDALRAYSVHIASTNEYDSWTGNVRVKQEAVSSALLLAVVSARAISSNSIVYDTSKKLFCLDSSLTNRMIVVDAATALASEMFIAGDYSNSYLLDYEAYTNCQAMGADAPYPQNLAKLCVRLGIEAQKLGQYNKAKDFFHEGQFLLGRAFSTQN